MAQDSICGQGFDGLEQNVHIVIAVENICFDSRCCPSLVLVVYKNMLIAFVQRNNVCKAELTPVGNL